MAEAAKPCRTTPASFAAALSQTLADISSEKEFDDRFPLPAI